MKKVLSMLIFLGLLVNTGTTLADAPQGCQQSKEVTGWESSLSPDFWLIDGEKVAKAYRDQTIENSLNLAIHDAKTTCEGWIYKGKVKDDAYNVLDQKCNWKSYDRNLTNGYWNCMTKVSVSCCF